MIETAAAGDRAPHMYNSGVLVSSYLRPAVVFVSDNWIEATMVACALEGHDIPSITLDDNVGRIFPQAALVIGGVKVLVPFDDLEDASEVLEAVYKQPLPVIGGTLTVPLSILAALGQWLLRTRRYRLQEDSRL